MLSFGRRRASGLEQLMKPGQASRTAVLTCMGRALAHGRAEAAQFADPTALALLPAEARALVERLRAGIAPKGPRERLRDLHLRSLSQAMVARTVAIDQAIRAAASPQLVILGAGLDGRAWRLAELADVTVFEVDHPDSQRDKHAGIAGLTQHAREVRFVPVDFAKDALDAALGAAGHDPTKPTTWVWEGVVMYLTEAESDATLAVIGRRSAECSRLIVLYHSPALVLKLVGFMTRRLGEPLRSAFTVNAMRALLERHGFTVAADQALPAIGAALSGELGRAIRSLKHLRLAIAEAADGRGDPISPHLR
jgi:methyltransferase (TIGR00027 family)